MELIQKPSPESKVMSSSFGKGAQSQHGMGDDLDDFPMVTMKRGIHLLLVEFSFIFF